MALSYKFLLRAVSVIPSVGLLPTFIEKLPPPRDQSNVASNCVIGDVAQVVTRQDGVRDGATHSITHS